MRMPITCATTLALLCGFTPAARSQVTPAVPTAPAAGAPVAGATPVAAAPTRNLWSFLCLSPEQKAACKEAFCDSTFGQLMNNSLKPVSALTGGVLPGCCPPVRASDLLKPANSAEGAASQIKKDEAESKARRAAARYLGTVDCRYWPEAQEALIASLRADRNECVRLEAAYSLARGCCCSKETMTALILTVTGSREDGNPCEPSERVRTAAEFALKRCLDCYVEVKRVPTPPEPPPVVLPLPTVDKDEKKKKKGLEKGPEKGPDDDPANGTKPTGPGTAAAKPNPAVAPPSTPAEYYKRVALLSSDSIIASARRALAASPRNSSGFVSAEPVEGESRSLAAILSQAFTRSSSVTPPPSEVVALPPRVHATRVVSEVPNQQGNGTRGLISWVKDNQSAPKPSSYVHAPTAPATLATPAASEMRLAPVPAPAAKASVTVPAASQPQPSPVPAPSAPAKVTPVAAPLTRTTVAPPTEKAVASTTAPRPASPAQPQKPSSPPAPPAVINTSGPELPDVKPAAVAPRPTPAVPGTTNLSDNSLNTLPAPPREDGAAVSAPPSLKPALATSQAPTPPKPATTVPMPAASAKASVTSAAKPQPAPVAVPAWWLPAPPQAMPRVEAAPRGSSTPSQKAVVTAPVSKPAAAPTPRPALPPPAQAAATTQKAVVTGPAAKPAPAALPALAQMTSTPPAKTVTAMKTDPAVKPVSLVSAAPAAKTTPAPATQPQPRQDSVAAFAPVSLARAAESSPVLASKGELLNILQTDYHPTQRERAVEQLGKLRNAARDPQVVQALFSKAVSDPAPLVRVACLVAIQKLKIVDSNLIGLLGRVKADSDARVRLTAEEVDRWLQEEMARGAARPPI